VSRVKLSRRASESPGIGISRRLPLALLLTALAVGVAATRGSSASFNDSAPCPASGPLLVCPTMYVGQPVHLQLIALAGCDVYRWEIVNGALPDGLAMSSSGLVTGTPTVPVTTQPWVTVHDVTATEGGPGWCGGDNHSERQFVFTVTGGGGGSGSTAPAPGPAVQPGGKLTASASPDQLWEVGRPLQISITATGGTPGYTWKVSGKLPAKTALVGKEGNGSTGYVRGVPAEPGTFPITLTVTDASGASAKVTATLSVAPRLRIKTSGAGRARVARPYRLALAHAGGIGDKVWVLADGALPPGLSLDVHTGIISGKPRVAGGFLFTVLVADSFGAKASRTYGLVVRRR
jgi:putative Ig domain-containing protein